MPRKRTTIILGRILLGLLLLAIATWLFFLLSPWPTAMLIRRAFDKEGIRVNEALAKHVPGGVRSVKDLKYDEDDDAKMDIHFPDSIAENNSKKPVIIWIHGGGLISGSKDQVANYCRIIASKGYVVAAIDYSLAPEKKYPVPVEQTNRAIDFLKKNAGSYHIDTTAFILAGDSGGSHIATQLANVIYNASYAKLLNIIPAIAPQQLPGMVLYCGPYDIENINTEGEFGGFMRTVLWSYSGTKDFANDKKFKTASILKYIQSPYPACFISAGNGDPLLPDSKALAALLSGLEIPVDTLFFPASQAPPLPHEYQFNLDDASAKLAMQRSLQFLDSVLTRGYETVTKK